MHDYKAAASAKFLDKLVDVATPYGYVEVERNVGRMQGKRMLGGIDLVLFNVTKNHALLIEGESHALPLSVYLCSPEAIDAHVSRTMDWGR